MRNLFLNQIVFLFLFGIIGCNNSSKKVKVDFINGNLNNTPISSFIYDEEMNYYRDYRENSEYIEQTSRSKLYKQVSKAINDDVKNYETLLKKYGLDIRIEFQDNDNKFYKAGVFEIYFDNDIPYEDKKLFKGEVTAGINKNTGINEIRQLFGKESYSGTSSLNGFGSYTVVYTNILDNDLVVSFIFRTSYKRKPINNKYESVDENGKIIKKGNEEAYITNLALIKIRHKRWVYGI